MTTTKARSNMRVSAPNLDLIREAAGASGQDMTSFVLCAALEADAVEIPALQRLLASTLGREYSPRSASDAVTS